jgi:nucleotide-binding universal stress UspA family protein
MILSMKTNIKRIVVGADGSDGSQAALAWAAHEASLRGVELVVVSIWHPSDGSDAWSGHQVLLGGDLDAAARATVTDMIEDLKTSWTEQQRFPPVEIVTKIGSAAEELLQFVGPNDLLVVGARGRKGIAGLILGSVATRVSHLAAHPYVVVPN